MGLEKFDDAIAEYLETKRKHTRDALKLADLSDSDIEKYCKFDFDYNYIEFNHDGELKGFIP